MRSAAKPKRNRDSDARMLAAASPRTIIGDRMRKAVMPATMTINHKPPAILALRRGEPSAIRSVISNPPVWPPHERGATEYSNDHQSCEASVKLRYGTVGRKVRLLSFAQRVGMITVSVGEFVPGGPKGRHLPLPCRLVGPRL